MWIIDYANVTLFNQNTGASVDFDYSKAANLFFVRMHNPIRIFGTSREAIDFIHDLAQLLGAASVPMPPPEPDGKPEPF